MEDLTEVMLGKAVGQQVRDGLRDEVPPALKAGRSRLARLWNKNRRRGPLLMIATARAHAVEELLGTWLI